MLTMISNPDSAHHALNREGTAALCRKNITPYTWTTLRNTTESATYEVHGEPFRRSTHAHRVTCLACQRKLTKITAEAFGAAGADQARTGATPAAKLTAPMLSLLGRLANDLAPRTPGRSGTIPTISRALIARGLATITGEGYIVITDAGRAALPAPAMGPEAFDHLPADHPAPVASAPESPFPVGSRVAAHLSPERVYLVDSVEVGTYDGRTRVYLVHPDGERLAFQPSVLAKMYAPAVAPVELYDHRRYEAMHVLGQSIGVDGDAELLFRYENENQSPDAPYRSVPLADLVSARYTAVCPHRFDNQGMRCPTCNPFPSTAHLIGERVTLDPINNHRSGTVSGVLVAVEDAGSFDFVAGVLDGGRRVRVTRSLVEATLANLPKSSG